jgi:hypothetical protein
VVNTAFYRCSSAFEVRNHGSTLNPAKLYFTDYYRTTIFIVGEDEAFAERLSIPCIHGKNQYGRQYSNLSYSHRSKSDTWFASPPECCHSPNFANSHTSSRPRHSFPDTLRLSDSPAFLLLCALNTNTLVMPDTSRHLMSLRHLPHIFSKKLHDYGSLGIFAPLG